MTIRAGLLAVAVLTLPVPALAQVDEDALFGGKPAADVPATPAPSPSPAPAVVADPIPAPVPESHVSDTLRAADSTLAVGGQAYFRLNGSFTEDASPAKGSLSSPDLLDVYLDARPNDRVRAFAKGRVRADPTIKDGSTDDFGNVRHTLGVTLPELWLKFDVGRTVFATVGRQPIRWGSGYFWNPTDFVNASRKEPLAVFDERPGVDCIKLHLPVESAGLNFYALGLLGEANSPEKVGVAGRAEIAFWQVEFAASAAWRKDSALRLGGDVSLGLGDFDFRVEGAVVHGDPAPFFEGPMDLATGRMPVQVSRKDRWDPSVMGGVEATIPYGDDDSVIVGAEYSWRRAGYSDPSVYPALFASGTFQPLYTGRHYAGIYALLMAPGQWNDGTVILSGLGNLSDRTFTTRADVRVTVLTHLSVNAFAGYNFGNNGELHYSLRVPAAPSSVLDLVPDEYRSMATKGVVIRARAVDVGIGLLVRI